MRRREPPSAVGGTIRRLRRDRGLSLKQAGEALGVHFTTVAAWERGRSRPPYRLLDRLSGLLGVSAAFLLAPVPPASLRPFRPLAEDQGELLLRRLEEIRLAACLAVEMGRPGGVDSLARRTGLGAERLARLAGAQVRPRPVEIAALVRELGAPGEEQLTGLNGSEALDGEMTSTALPAGAEEQVRRIQAGLRRYVCGVPGSSHQAQKKGRRSR